MREHINYNLHAGLPWKATCCRPRANASRARSEQGHKKAELPTQPYKYKPLCGVPYNGRIVIRHKPPLLKGGGPL